MSGASRRVWIAGASGQLGTELIATKPAGFEVLANDVGGGVDITDRAAVLAFTAQFKPALIMNAAAYTAVDKAESERELAFRVNRDGAAHLAEAARRGGTRMIHVSTDYVFDGRQATPYRPDDAANPLNAYGESKLAGERAVQETCEGDALIVRTAWVYSVHGSNFVKTMLRLLRERKEVRVVCDQIGTPTHARGLAGALWRLADRADLRGTYHWTDAGVASWYDFAVAIRECARVRAGAVAGIVPIRSAEFPQIARRPFYGVLEKSASWQAVGYPPHWESALREVVAEIQTGAAP